MKQSIQLYLSILFLTSISQFSFAQTQLGPTINGENEGDKLGSVISLSANGNRVALGLPSSDPSGTLSGQFRIYEWNGTNWLQQGVAIDGELSVDQMGWSISLAGDGNRVAVGLIGRDDNGSRSGQARVYEWNGSSWNQLGNNMDGEAIDDEFGWAISLSEDGNRVAVGARGNEGSGPFSGHARVFEWDNENWNQMGSDIDSEAAGDQSGRSLALSADGGRIIIGAFANDGNGESSGHARIFDWDGTNWIQVGEDIDGEHPENQFGIRVAISTNGNRVAIGATINSDNGEYAGHTRVFDWNGSNWVQAGTDIDGEAAGDLSGRGLALSGDGNLLGVGANRNSGNGEWAGHVRIFKWNGNDWDQIGTDIDGEAAGDQAGGALDISTDGLRIAVGSGNNDDNGEDTGHVRIFTLPIISSVAELPKGDFQIYPNPTFQSIELIGSKADEFKIVDQFGRVLINRKMETPTIDLSHLHSGVYNLLVHENGQWFTRKIIKH